MREGFAARLSQGVVLGAPIIIAHGPFRANPAVLFEFVKRGIQGALTNLQYFTGHLMDALRNGPAVHGLQSNSFQNEEVEGALDEICGFTQAPSYQ